MKYVSTVALLLLSNSFMTLAWYGHLKFFGGARPQDGLLKIIIISWGIAFFEYCFQVPANRIGSDVLGGPFSLVQLKVIQEVITLVVFVAFSLIAFPGTRFTINQAIGFLLLIAAVGFIFKK